MRGLTMKPENGRGVLACHDCAPGSPSNGSPFQPASRENRKCYKAKDFRREVVGASGA